MSLVPSCDYELADYTWWEDAVRKFCPPDNQVHLELKPQLKNPLRPKGIVVPGPISQCHRITERPSNRLHSKPGRAAIALQLDRRIDDDIHVNQIEQARNRPRSGRKVVNTSRLSTSCLNHMKMVSLRVIVSYAPGLLVPLLSSVSLCILRTSHWISPFSVACCWTLE